MTSIDWQLVFEATKTILDPLAEASWPISFFVTALLFRKPLIRLLDRIKNIRGWGAEADLESGLVEDQRSDRSLGQRTDELALPAPSQPSSEHLAKFPPLHTVYGPVEADMAQRLGTLFPGDQDSQLRWALRVYAGSEVERFHESNFRIMFGSQLDLMHFANQRFKFDIADARAFYLNFQGSELYKELKQKPDFDQWLNFVTSISYLSKLDDGQAEITPLGRDFLGWIVGRGVALYRPG